MARGRARGWILLAGAFAVLAAATAPARPEDQPAIRIEAVDAALLARPGAALRHALASIEDGELERAERLLVALAQHAPVIADYADYERLKLLGLTGNTEEALALAEAWPHRESPLRARVYAQLGRLRAELGEEEAARAAFERALAASESDAMRAELRLELGRSYLRSQLPVAAADALLELWTRHPMAPEASEAERELEQLERVRGQALRSADRYRRRGDVLFRNRHNEQALAAYEHALALGTLNAAGRRRAERQRAETLFRLRRYSEAVEAYAALPQDADARISRARAVARSGNAAGAARELERIAEQVRGQQGAYAKLLAALLWEDEGETQHAQALFAALTGTGYATSALWRLGWQAYREGRYEQARSYLQQLAQRSPDALGALQARYWDARAAERAGSPDAAERFGELAREFPLSYYGWRASERAAQGPSRTERWTPEPGEVALSPRQLERPRILLEAGLDEAALEELDRLFVRAKGLEDRLALAELYANAGDFHRPQRLVVDAYQETLARGPAPGPLELWWHAWPAPFQEAVQGATRERQGLRPELVYAIMREESGYRPDVLSVAGARGLLQLMPETAERVARREALPEFQPEDLFLPQVNIQLGAAYLAELLRQFGGRPSATIGSYNAGPHRVVRWLDGNALDDDEWVEAIPYEQTRNYVKRVLRSVHAYRVLY